MLHAVITLKIVVDSVLAKTMTRFEPSQECPQVDVRGVFPLDEGSPL